MTDELWLVHEGRKEVFEGDLDDYAKIVLDHRRVTAAEARAEHQADKAARNEAQPVNNKEARRLAAQERARIAELRKPLKKELEKVEREMNALSEKLKALDTQLADPAFYNGADQGKVAQTLREHGELAPKVEALEMHWLELSEKSKPWALPHQHKRAFKRRHKPLLQRSFKRTKNRSRAFLA